MRDFFLRFPDEATARTHLYDTEYTYADDGTGDSIETQTPRYRNVDVIGLIDSDAVAMPSAEGWEDGYVYVPVYLSDPNDPRCAPCTFIGGHKLIDGYTEAGEHFLQTAYVEEFIPHTYIPLPGWHVNIRALDDEDTSSLEQFCVHPTNPRRVWA